MYILLSNVHHMPLIEMSKYRIAAVLKVETDIIASIAASSTG